VKAISGLSSAMRDTYKVKGMDDSRSFITAMKSFPMNIEVVQGYIQRLEASSNGR
jgi:hypothetical protein